MMFARSSNGIVALGVRPIMDFTLSLEGAGRNMRPANPIYATNCLASATSIESPSGFKASSPVSGMSPDVLCDTAIF